METKKTQGITAKKEKNFSDWYSQLVQKAELVDIRFGIQGFIVHRPWGFKIIKKIYELFEKEVELDGHEPFLFPIAVKEKNLKKESDHAGFIPDVFWVERAGNKKLKERFALRPTGEAQIYPLYSLWIRSYKDLPLKAYQSRISVFRNEKTTRPFIRGREFLFFETHDVFRTHEEVINQIKKDLEISKKVIYDHAKIPFLFFKRPHWDKFKGADDTYTPDTIMPDGKRNQLASTHNLGKNFSKAFNIKFIDQDKKTKYAYQSCYGPGIWRILAAMIAIHGDNKGLILPFEFAPIQVIIIPIFFSEKQAENKKIINYCKKLKKSLEKYHITKIDLSDNSPGFKFNEWELKGVPIRLEIGPNEVRKKEVTLVKRTDGKKLKIKLKNISKEIRKTADLLNKKIESNAIKYFKGKIKKSNNLDETIKLLKNHVGFIKVPFCSIEMDGEKCAEILKEASGGDVCGILYPKEEKLKRNEKCIVCNKKAKHIVYIAKSY